MSAFAVIHERSSRICEPNIINKVMERLSHRGPNGSDICLLNNAAMGHWHFWTTPEEVDELQPFGLSDLPLKIVLDGRIDNREELFLKLDLPGAKRESISDSELILRAYSKWGESCFEKFIGEFALVIFDELKREFICVRDQLGDRTLFYALYGAKLVIASEPWAVAGALSTKPELNENTVAQYFGLKFPEDGQTFFKDIYELLPARIMVFGVDYQRSWTYWQPDPNKKIRYNTDQEYAEHFRKLLEESIRCRMRSSKQIGVLMSGGLDSTSVASLAARMTSPDTLNTLSYVFDELTECDERVYIDAVVKLWKIKSIQFTGDESWTFNDWNNWPRNPNGPDRNFYRLLLENTYKCARDEGLQVLLTGYMGDFLYAAGSDWIADLIVDGKFKKALDEWFDQIRTMGWIQTLKTGHLRRAIRRLLDSIMPGKLRFSRTNKIPEWIRPEYNDAFGRKGIAINPVFERHGSLLSPATASDVAYSIRNTSRYGLEFRNPYRDLRLVEFVLAIPAYQLYQHGFLKYILRNAMHGILPEIVKTRVMRTVFESLYYNGLEREKDLCISYLKDVHSKWRKFIKADWVNKIPDLLFANSVEGLLPYSCISYEVWVQNY